MTSETDRRGVLTPEQPPSDVTPEMVEAGVSVFWSYDSRFEEAEGFVIRLFEVMQAAQPPSDDRAGDMGPIYRQLEMVEMMPPAARVAAIRHMQAALDSLPRGPGARRIHE